MRAFDKSAAVTDGGADVISPRPMDRQYRPITDDLSAIIDGVSDANSAAVRHTGGANFPSVDGHSKRMKWDKYPYANRWRWLGQ